MESQTHSLTQLFAQLGLPNSQDEVNRFIATHRPLANEIALADAPFWKPAQRAFLKEEIAEDADWAAVVDALNNLLRA